MNKPILITVGLLIIAAVLWFFARDKNADIIPEKSPQGPPAMSPAGPPSLPETTPPATQ